MNYYNAFWGPYGDGGGDVCTPGGVTGGSGVTNLNPPPQQIWGRTDYFPIPGLHNTALLAAGMNPGYIAKVGEGKDSGTITNNLITGKIKMSSITDGSVEHHDGFRVRLEADRLQRIQADLPLGGQWPAR